MAGGKSGKASLRVAPSFVNLRVISLSELQGALFVQALHTLSVTQHQQNLPVTLGQHHPRLALFLLRTSERHFPRGGVDRDDEALEQTIAQQSGFTLKDGALVKARRHVGDPLGAKAHFADAVSR